MEVPDDLSEIDAGLVYFKCPNGHVSHVTRRQLVGDDPIDCTGEFDGCDFSGYVDDGEVVPKVSGPE